MQLDPSLRTLLRGPTTLVALAGLVGSAVASSYSFTTIDAPNDPALVGTVVSSINNSGTTAGYYVTATPFGPSYSAFTSHADGSGFTTLSRAGTIALGGSGIDSAGDIVGVSVDFTGTATGFKRDPAGNYVTINPATGGLTSGYSEAVGINDAGTIVGFYAESAPSPVNPNPAEHGFIDIGGAFTSVDYPGGLDTELDTINNNGVMTGGYIDGSGNQHAFMYSGGIFTPVSAPGYTQSMMSSVNNLGVYLVSGLVVDNGNASGNDAFSFLYSGGSYHPFMVPGSISTDAFTINDLGQISGYYVDGNEQIHGFVATPMAVPEPAPMTAFALMAGAGLLRRRRNGR